MDTESSPTHGNRYLTFAQLADAYPAFTIGGLRWLAFHRETNGLSAAVLRIGRRLLVSEREWVAWLEGNREVKAPTSPPPAQSTRRAAGGRRNRNTAAA